MSQRASLLQKLEKGGKRRKLLIRCIGTCSVRPEIQHKRTFSTIGSKLLVAKLGVQRALIQYWVRISFVVYLTMRSQMPNSPPPPPPPPDSPTHHIQRVFCTVAPSHPGGASRTSRWLTTVHSSAHWTPQAIHRAHGHWNGLNPISRPERQQKSPGQEGKPDPSRSEVGSGVLWISQQLPQGQVLPLRQNHRFRISHSNGDR